MCRVHCEGHFKEDGCKYCRIDQLIIEATKKDDARWKTSPEKRAWWREYRRKKPEKRYLKK